MNTNLELVSANRTMYIVTYELEWEPGIKKSISFKTIKNPWQVYREELYRYGHSKVRIFDLNREIFE